MAGSDNSTSSDQLIPKFKGKSTEDYQLWRFRVEAALRGKQYWSEIPKESCSEKIKDHSFSILVAVLGDAALRNCQKDAPDTLKMLSTLDKHYASKRPASRISVLTALFSKRYKDSTSMSKYIDDFNKSFAMLEVMGEDATIPESLKAPILLASFGTDSKLESVIAALRVKSEIPKWEELTSDLTFEAARCQDAHQNKKKNRDHRQKHGSGAHHRHDHPSGSNGTHHANSVQNHTCEFCGRKGHIESDCFDNPYSSNCKLTPQAKKSLAKALKKNARDDAPKIKFGGLMVGVQSEKSSQDHSEGLSNEHTCLGTNGKMSLPPCLDSGATSTFFQKANEVSPGSYKQGSFETVTLAAGTQKAKCLGKGTITIGITLLLNATIAPYSIPFEPY